MLEKVIETESLGRRFGEVIAVDDVTFCVTKGEDLCPMNDDRIAIEKRTESADGIILASPGYMQNVSWLVKNFIDRFAYTHHRPKFLDKRVMIIANGGAGLDKLLDSLGIAIGGPWSSANWHT